MTDPIARVVHLTPQLADELLSRNPRNRKINNRNYGVVKRAISQGEWELNGEAIKVSQNGYILDGQHRCMAVVETGIAIRTFLIEGLPDSTQDTMDTGKTRSLADILHIRGETNSTNVAALIRRFVLADRYGFEAAFSTYAGGTRSLTNRELLEWFDQNPWVREYVHPGRHIADHSPLGGATAGFLMRTFDQIDREDSDHFWGRLVDGLIADPAGDPIHVLRETLRRLDENTRGERNQKYISALVVKAWNAYREGSKVGMFKYRAGGAKPEAFPKPV